MTALLANLASVHPGLHAHPHDNSWVHSLTTSPWAAFAVGAAVLAAGVLLLRSRQRG